MNDRGTAGAAAGLRVTLGGLRSGLFLLPGSMRDLLRWCLHGTAAVSLGGEPMSGPVEPAGETDEEGSGGNG